jgi:hypothetical protein
MGLAQKQTEDQWIRIEDPDISPHIYSQLIYNKGVKTHDGEKIATSTNAAGKTCRRLKLDPPLLPCTKINSKWIKDLNIRPETLTQLQETVGNTLEQIGIGNDFLNRTPKVQHLKETMNK